MNNKQMYRTKTFRFEKFSKALNEVKTEHSIEWLKQTSLHGSFLTDWKSTTRNVDT